MINLFNIKNTLILFILLFSLIGCGYTPNAKFSRDVLGEKISTSVIISAQDPQNTVVIKDAVDKAVIEVFHASLVTQDRSDSHLVIKMATPTYTPIVYDENGFITGYRMSITLNITKHSKKSSKSYNTRGFHDF